MYRFLLGILYLITPVVWVGGIAIHLWTTYIAFQNSGFIGTALTFFLPFFSQLYWGFVSYDTSGFDAPYIQWLIFIVCLVTLQYFIMFIISLIAAKEEENVNSEIAASSEVIEVSTNKPYLYGFGGWLILLSIGFIIGFFQSAFYIYDTLLPLINSGQVNEWIKIDVMWGVVVFFEIVFNLSVVTILAITGYMCIKQKRLFVKLSIIYIILILFGNAVGYFVYLSVPETAEMSSDTLTSIIQSAFYAAIWIPYLLKSQRVKNTYTF